MIMCGHCNDPQTDCDMRTHFWRDEGLLVACVFHLDTHKNVKELVELTDEVICGNMGCKEKGVYLVK